MSKDMAMVLGGRLLPKPSTFKRTLIPNETDITTLGGTLYTDFVNNRREWEVGWKLILEDTDYDTIQELYLEQYENQTYHILQFDAYGIYTPVKMNISAQKIKYNGTLIEAFTITLKEQYAIS